jgi:hypothetical protein
MQSSDEEDHKYREKAFHNVLMGAWLNTKFERDKQLLGISATAIGLLVTLLRTGGVRDSSQLIVFSLALLAFLVTIVSALWILDANSTHIENVLNGSETESKTLMRLDKFAGVSFVSGMLLVVAIGIISAQTNLK